MALPTVAWDETTPADTALVSTGDNIIRQMKTQMRELVAVEHEMDSSGQDTDWGWHKKVTLYEQGSNPSSVSNAIILFVKDVSGKPELHFKDESGNVMQITSAGQIIAGMTDEIRMFYGTLAQIPDGWALCDGASGRPNLLAKFIRGIATVSTEPEVNSGGADSVTLTEANMPSHTHAATNEGSGHYHTINYLTGYGTGTTEYFVTEVHNSRGSTKTGFQTSGGHYHNGGYSGSNPTIDNRPAYYELAFLIRE